MFIKKYLITRDWNWKNYFAAFYIKLKTIWHWNDCRVSVMVIVFKATFNNSSIISWWPVLLVDETGVPGENHQPVASHWQTLSHNVVSSTPRHEWRFTIEIVVYLKYIEVSNKCLSTNIQLSHFLSTNYTIIQKLHVFSTKKDYPDRSIFLYRRLPHFEWHRVKWHCISINNEYIAQSLVSLVWFFTVLLWIWIQP